MLPRVISQYLNCLYLPVDQLKIATFQEKEASSNLRSLAIFKKIAAMVEQHKFNELTQKVTKTILQEQSKKKLTNFQINRNLERNMDQLVQQALNKLMLTNRELGDLVNINNDYKQQIIKFLKQNLEKNHFHSLNSLTRSTNSLNSKNPVFLLSQIGEFVQKMNIHKMSNSQDSDLFAEKFDNSTTKKSHSKKQTMSSQDSSTIKVSRNMAAPDQNLDYLAMNIDGYKEQSSLDPEMDEGSHKAKQVGRRVMKFTKLISPKIQKEDSQFQNELVKQNLITKLQNQKNSIRKELSRFSDIISINIDKFSDNTQQAEILNTLQSTEPDEELEGFNLLRRMITKQNFKEKMKKRKFKDYYKHYNKAYETLLFDYLRDLKVDHFTTERIKNEDLMKTFSTKLKKSKIRNSRMREMFDLAEPEDSFEYHDIESSDEESYITHENTSDEESLEFPIECKKVTKKQINSKDFDDVDGLVQGIRVIFFLTLGGVDHREEKFRGYKGVLER